VINHIDLFYKNAGRSPRPLKELSALNATTIANDELDFMFNLLWNVTSEKKKQEYAIETEKVHLDNFSAPIAQGASTFNSKYTLLHVYLHS